MTAADLFKVREVVQGRSLFWIESKHLFIECDCSSSVAQSLVNKSEIKKYGSAARLESQ